MNEIEIKKSTLYIIGIIALVLISGFFFLKSGDGFVIGNLIGGSFNGEVQKVVIGMKNYNYYPNTIQLKVGIPVSISLDKSVSGCFRDFTIREFGVREYLRTPQDTIEFTPTKKGTYTFACSMGMGTGTLIIE